MEYQEGIISRIKDLKRIPDLENIRSFKVGVDLARGRPRKILGEVIDLEEQKVRKELAKDKNDWKSVIRSNSYMCGKQTLNRI